MKKTIFIITGLFILLQWGCRFEELETPCMEKGFEKKYDYGFAGAAGFTTRDIIETVEGDYVVCGEIAGNFDDIFILKVDKNGNQIFFEQDFSSERELSWSIVRTPDNGFLVCGKNKSQNGALFIKYDETGQRISDKISTVSGSDCRYIIQTRDGSFAFAGARETSPRSTYAGILTLNGQDIEITKEYISTVEPYQQEAHAIIQTPANEYIIVGESKKNITNFHQYIFKLNQNFELVSNSEVFELFDNNSAKGRSIAKAHDGNGYIVAGWDSGQSFAFRYHDNTNSVTTMAKYSGTGTIDGYSIVQGHNEGEYIVAGDQWIGSNAGTALRQVFVSKIDETGNQIWTKLFGDENLIERGFRIIKTTDCGYAIVGFEVDNIATKT